MSDQDNGCADARRLANKELEGVEQSTEIYRLNKRISELEANCTNSYNEGYAYATLKSAERISELEGYREECERQFQEKVSRITELEALCQFHIEEAKKHDDLLLKRNLELEAENKKYKEAWSVNILTERINELEATLRYIRDGINGVWMDYAGEVSAHVLPAIDKVLEDNAT